LRHPRDQRSGVGRECERRAGVAQFAHTALNLSHGTDEAMEGRNAFVEKRPVDFRKFRT
jgi:1,4-dihydroxy-2-naphthoyl-CoA synthase